MSALDTHSGPWLGWSIQDGIRITERLRLTITKGQITGEGTDMDGDFEVSGNYTARDNAVRLTRRYTRTTEPSQSGVGIPYDYTGKWDGALVSGVWKHRTYDRMTGPFEMWPAGDENSLLEALSREEELVVQDARISVL